MRYILLIQTDEAVDRLPPGSPEFLNMMAGYQAAMDAASSLGILESAEPLAPVSATRTVLVRGGRTVVTDGPFIETKEQLSGFFVLRDATLAQAEAIAAMIPGALHGAVEVRPLPGMAGP
ncbi:MAG: YciI family protein [Dehalococcoidia bacterium]